MKFELKIQHDGQTGSDSINIEGDLDAVKTYLKLVVSDNFNWGAVERKGELEPGDVHRWLVEKNHTTGDMTLTVFSFYKVDPEININAAFAAVNPESNKTEALSKVLGGGKF